MNTADAEQSSSPPPAESPDPRVESEEATSWVEDRTGAVINTAFIAAALSIAGRPPLRDTMELLRRVVDKPEIAAEPARAVLRETGKIFAGESELEPWRGDRRYSDPAWQSNPVLRTLAQVHAAVSNAAEAVVENAELDPITGYRMQLTAHNVAAALSPANNPFVNPAAVKAALDSGGTNLLRGAVRFVHDMRKPPRLPLRSDPADFVLGVQLAATDGAVVERTPLYELLQYRERTRRVRVEPVLIVPSVVNKFYLTDMAPGRSLVEFAVASGRPVYSLSWVNPNEELRDEGLDSYVGAVLSAAETVRAISASERVHILGVCAGGQLASLALSRLAADEHGQDAIASLAMLVCVLDYSTSRLPQRLLDDEAAELALRPVMSRGYVDGRAMTAALAWLRPNDSVWWPWVERYLVAADMPKLDLFAWSEDVTNLTAAYVRDELELTRTNALVTPGSMNVLDRPIDLGAVTVDSYLVAGRTDHLTPWEACYRTAGLLGSDPRFVLVDGGHIQSILRSPTERVIPFFHGLAGSASPDEWLEGADVARASWWEDWVGWLDERSPADRGMRRRLGDADHPVLDPAPGRYVHRRLDDE